RGHAAVGETQPGVADVLMTAEHTQSDCLDVNHRRPDQRQQEVEVVDHQVHDHADVGRAAGENAEPFAGHKFRLQSAIHQLFKGGIETLDVADLERGAMQVAQVR